MPPRPYVAAVTGSGSYCLAFQTWVQPVASSAFSPGSPAESSGLIQTPATFVVDVPEPSAGQLVAAIRPSYAVRSAACTGSVATVTNENGVFVLPVHFRTAPPVLPLRPVPTPM